MTHRFFVWLHRWTGLTMTVFLVLVGLTGSILAFKTKIDRLINPRLYVEPPAGAAPLDPATLAERAEAQLPHMRVAFLSVEREHVQIECGARTNPAIGKPFDLGFDELFLDPYTGNILGHRRWGDLSEGRINLIPFIYRLHFALALGPTGGTILGIIALMWTLDCFVGFYLTLPQGPGSFWKRWKHAWWVKWRAGSFRVNFDLHRAGGLLFWLFAFIFAWSGVMFNLNPVYERVTGAFFDYETMASMMSMTLPHPKDNPKLGWPEAQVAGERLMSEQAAKRRLTIIRPSGIGYIPDSGVYQYYVRTAQDIQGGGSDTGVWVDGDTGELRKVFLPYGQHTGNTISDVLVGLHFGDIHDILAYRILVCIFGFVIAMLSVTGVYIWWKKRQRRKLAGAVRRRVAEEGRFNDAPRPMPGAAS